MFIHRPGLRINNIACFHKNTANTFKALMYAYNKEYDKFDELETVTTDVSSIGAVNVRYIAKYVTYIDTNNPINIFHFLCI